ncbi:MAG: hypothetical protein HFJ33_02500 [Clostridia bacterium]|nr:hypothetical protein [Clostridia bacterium]
MGNLEWPTKNVFKYACLKKEELEKDYLLIKAEDTIIKKDRKEDSKSEEMGR